MQNTVLVSFLFCIESYSHRLLRLARGLNHLRKDLGGCVDSIYRSRSRSTTCA
nr:MAG TPA: hypothetical protein [Caudoviricetes sp.]